MSSSLYLLSCDPGKLSGFVVLDITNFDTEGPKIEVAEEFEQQTTGSHIHWWTANTKNLEIVMEDFFITSETAKKKDTHFSREIIGVGRYFAGLYGHSFALQSPSAAKSFVDNNRIRDLDLWVKGGEGHHKDAMRHAILYLVQTKKWKTSKLLGE